MKIRNVLVSEAFTNCYLVKNEETNEGFILDPGGDVGKIVANIGNLDMKPVAILLTHGHYDHIGAVDELREKYGIKVYVSKIEMDLMNDQRQNLSLWFGADMAIKGDVALSDGQEIEIAGIKMKFILTPGHTPGSGCYYVESEGVLFSGDTLFYMS
ncbi:MAG: MBL fold metallo-hydrolase, partial [Eubacterium sp.]|nr:MBL fold metallo-hydrolase [Eubacterium sp.]